MSSTCPRYELGVLFSSVWPSRRRTPHISASSPALQSRDRVIGVCFLDGTDLGETLMRAGHARDCPHFSGGRYIQAEVAARETERDLSRLYALPENCP